MGKPARAVEVEPRRGPKRGEPSDLCRQVGARLAREREVRGLTQADVAALVAKQPGHSPAVGRNYVSKWESGHALTIDNVVAVCRAIGISVKDLLP